MYSTTLTCVVFIQRSSDTLLTITCLICLQSLLLTHTHYLHHQLHGSDVELSAAPALPLDTFWLQVKRLNACQFLHWVLCKVFALAMQLKSCFSSRLSASFSRVSACFCSLLFSAVLAHPVLKLCSSLFVTGFPPIPTQVFCIITCNVGKSCMQNTSDEPLQLLLAASTFWIPPIQSKIILLATTDSLHWFPVSSCLNALMTPSTDACPCDKTSNMLTTEYELSLDMVFTIKLSSLHVFGLNVVNHS